MKLFNVAWLRHWALLCVCVFIAACTPPSAEDRLNKARAHLAADDPSSAVIELKNVLQSEPHHAEAQLLLGGIYITMGDLPLALRELEGAFDSGIDKKRVLKPLLSTKNRQGRYREVIGELEGENGLDAELENILGEAYLVGKNHDKARSHFNRALALEPENGRASLGLALTAIAKGDVFTATGHYSDAVLWTPQNHEVWIQKGNFELASQKPELALESFGRALELDGPGYIANLGVARSYIGLGQMADADLAISKVLSETRKVPVAYYIKAQLLFQEGELIQAARVLDNVLKIAPNYPEAHYLKAAVYFREQKFGLAQDSLRSLLKAHPDNMQVRLLLATSQYHLGEAKSALATLESKVDEIESSNGLALLGSLYLQTNQKESAIRSLTAALALDPANNKIRTQLALGYLADGDSAKAVEELQRAVAGGGVSVQDDVLLVLVKIREGDLNAALVEAQKFQARQADSVIAHNLLGSVYLAMSNQEAAKLAFESATRLDTAYSPAVFNLAKMASSSGDVEGARTIYRNFLAANPNSLEVHIALGRLELGAGNLEAASANFIRAVELDVSVNGEQKVATISFELGRVELKHKNTELARKHFKQALDISSGTHKQALLALIQIERVSGKSDQLKKLFSQLEKLMPDSVIYFMLLAESQLEDKQLVAAKSSFKKAADQKHRGATLRYASFLESNDQISEAITVLEGWITSNSSDLAAAAMLGGYYLKEESAENAVKIYEGLDLRSPNNAALLNNLAWAYYLTKDDRAEAVARKAYNLSPDNAHMADTLGWILVQNDKFADALEIFDRALGTEPDNASIYYHAAVVYNKSSRVQEARDSLDKALAMGEFPERAEAENLVRNLKI